MTDDALFNCPYTVASDVGTMGLRDDEVLRLRQYLLKGGFLWVDDFWGTLAWEHWSRRHRAGAARATRSRTSARPTRSSTRSSS